MPVRTHPPSRRAILRMGAGTLAAVAMPSAGHAQAARFRRWEVTDPAMPARVLDSYKRGIAAMLQLPPTDPRNWYRNAFVHVFDCPHGNWWFLTWHRGYLGWLEQTLRDLSGDAQFALPYWDWTKTPRIPAALFDGVLDPDDAAYIDTFAHFRARFGPAVQTLWTKFSPAQRAALQRRGLNTAADFWTSAERMFFGRPNARGLTAAAPDLDPTTKVAVGGATLRSALQAPVFAGAGTGTSGAGFASAKAANHSDSSAKGILESQPHDNVHGAIGGASGEGLMTSFLSPADPVFFLHHGNLDRLWDVWSRRQTALRRPALPQGADLAVWSGEKFLFFSDSKGMPAPKTNAGDYATMATFDYDYSPGSGEDLVPPPSAVIASVQPLRSFGAQLRAAPAAPGALAGGTAQVPAAAARPPAPEAAPEVAEVTLNLQPGDQGRRFRVLVSAAGGEPVEAGGITVFNHHDHGPTTFTVPLPEGIRAGAGTSLPLDVRVVPVARAPTTGPRATGLALSAAPRPVPLQSIRILTE